MAQSILSLLRRLNRWVAMVIGLVLFLCAVFVLLDIGLRKLGASFGGTDEISGYVMAIVTSWGMGFALLELANVRIDIIRSRAGSLGRAIFDLFSMVVLSGTVSVIAVKCWPVLDRSISNLSRANTPLETPLWLVQGPWFAGWVWFAIVSWLTFVAALLMVLRGEFQQAEAAIGAFGEEEAVL
jgi:TRAP-type mannitol/chloroaromatic compound transport system permease small subunit